MCPGPRCLTARVWVGFSAGFQGFRRGSAGRSLVTVEKVYFGSLQVESFFLGGVGGRVGGCLPRETNHVVAPTHVVLRCVGVSHTKCCSLRLLTSAVGSVASVLQRDKHLRAPWLKQPCRLGIAATTWKLDGAQCCPWLMDDSGFSSFGWRRYTHCGRHPIDLEAERSARQLCCGSCVIFVGMKEIEGAFQTCTLPPTKACKLTLAACVSWAVGFACCNMRHALAGKIPARAAAVAVGALAVTC
jgi:hypothetical protein